MTTPATRSAVSLRSLAAALTAVLALGACAHNRPPTTWDETALHEEQRAGIRFENLADTYVDVYLIGEQREWWLGRVATGALTTLRVPDGAWPTGPGFVKLAVLANAWRTTQAARDPRATLTIAQPPSQLLTQRWTFRHTPLASPEIFGAR